MENQAPSTPYRWFRTLRVVCIIVGLCILVLAVYKYAVYPIVDPIEAIIPLYLMIFGIFIIFTELRFKWILNNLLFLDSLYGKGLFFIFVGSLCLDLDVFAIVVGSITVLLGILFACANNKLAHKPARNIELQNAV